MTAIVTSYMMSKFDIKKIQERNSKKLVIVFCIEFYDFWSEPQLNQIKWRHNDVLCIKIRVIATILILCSFVFSSLRIHSLFSRLKPLKVDKSCDKNSCTVLNTAFLILSVVTKNRCHLRHRTSKIPSQW